ncbi:MAG: acyl-CoA dehydrogenase family protein [Inquilinaceae bacterium]
MSRLHNDDAPLTYPPRTEGFDAFGWDRDVQRLLARMAPGMMGDNAARLAEFGRWVGGPLDAQAAYTDRHAPPRLETHDRDGARLGRVVHNPAYSACHAEVYRRGVIGHAFATDGKPATAPHLLSFTFGYLLSQADVSIHCPVTMTGAVAHVLDRLAPRPVRDAYLPELTRMDGAALSGGTWATELHGGSDVGATTTMARADGAAWRLTGLKWFTSNAGAGLALATARPEGAPAGGKGLGCYLVPGALPDGTANRIYVRRLKDKIGTRGLATGEADLDGAWALEVAGQGDGLKTMLEALEYSRIHNAVAACGVHRRAFLESICWASHRHAFGQPIGAFPMVRDTLLDMVTELEAGIALAFEAASLFDGALTDDSLRPWLRSVTALAKHRTAQRAVEAAAQAVELVGGNGYTEDWPTARLYRDTLVLAVWEGPANIQALELLRAALGQSGADAFCDRVATILADVPAGLAAAQEAAAAALDRCRAALDHLRAAPEDGPRHARRLMDLMADTLSAALLLEQATADLAAGDGRKALVARRYVGRHFGPAPAIGPDPDPAHGHFDALVGYGRVPV